MFASIATRRVFTNALTVSSRTNLCRAPIPKKQIQFYNNYNSLSRRPTNSLFTRYPQTRLYIIGGGGVLIGMYYFAHMEKAPVTGRRRMMDVSPSAELEMGITAWNETKEENSGNILPASDSRVKFVKNVATPIIEASGLKMDWEIIVVENNEANAFVLPGGKICVYTGILKIATDPNELALVLGHEIGHVIARHHAEKWSFARIIFIGGQVVRFVVGDIIPEALLRMLMTFGMELPFSRTCEHEADHIGLLLMAQACYQPDKAIGFWAKMQENSHMSELSKFASTHPNPADRTKKLQELLPQAKEERMKSHCDKFKTNMKYAAY